MKEKILIAIGGPTASGKSKVAMELARHFHSEIINADSRQVYKEMNIGVNKPSEEELKTIHHYLIGHKSVFKEYNAGRYEQDALAAITHTFATHDIAILIGGTGLYINAVLNGIDSFPDISGEIKDKVSKLFESGGLEALQNKLLETDPEYAAVVDFKNPRRIARALEIVFTSGLPYSSFKQNQIKSRDFKTITIFIDKDRKSLYNIIDERVDQMIQQGLKEEAKALFPYRYLKALQTVGYSEWFDHFDGKISEIETIEKIKQHTRNYAKRQWTWWRPLHWPSFESNQLTQILNYINLKISE